MISKTEESVENSSSLDTERSEGNPKTVYPMAQNCHEFLSDSNLNRLRSLRFLKKITEFWNSAAMTPPSHPERDRLQSGGLRHRWCEISLNPTYLERPKTTQTKSDAVWMRSFGYGMETRYLVELVVHLWHMMTHGDLP